MGIIGRLAVPFWVLILAFPLWGETLPPRGLEPATHLGPTLLDYTYPCNHAAVFPVREKQETFVLQLYLRAESVEGNVLHINGGADYNAGEQIRLRLEPFNDRLTWAVYVPSNGQEDMYYARAGRDTSQAVYRFPHRGDWLFIGLGLRQTQTGAVLDIYTRDWVQTPAYTALVAPARNSESAGFYLEDVQLGATVREVSDLRVLAEFAPSIPQLTPLSKNDIPKIP